MDERGKRKNGRRTKRDVEILASGLLSSKVLYGRNIASAKEIRRWYNDFKLDTSKRAAVILLSVLLEYYRRRRGGGDISCYDAAFGLLLTSVFETEWNRLFPGTTVTRKRILEEPWSLLTINEVYNKHPVDSQSHGYEMCCKAILLEETDIKVDYRGKKYQRSCVVSVQRTRGITERLYKLAMCMQHVLQARGQI